MTKRKRTRKKAARTPPPTSKRASQKVTFVKKVKQNWPVWIISLLMACSLVGRFAGSTAQRSARARASQPPAVTTMAQNQAEQETLDREDFNGKLTVQAEAESSQEIAYHLRLPVSWHRKIETMVQNKVISFNYDLDSNTPVPIFTLAAYTDAAWDKAQAAGNHGQKLVDQDGIVIVDEIILDQTTAARTPELQAVLNDLPNILNTLATEPDS